MKCQCVLESTPELYDGVGGEQQLDKLEKLDISYMGPIFKKYRLDDHRTQEEVAEKVGITARFLMALENEERRPSLDILLRLVDTLNIPGDAILHPQLQKMDNEDEQLIRMLMRLDKRDREVICAAVEAMLKTADRKNDS